MGKLTIRQSQEKRHRRQRRKGVKAWLRISCERGASNLAIQIATQTRHNHIVCFYSKSHKLHTNCVHFVVASTWRFAQLSHVAHTPPIHQSTNPPIHRPNKQTLCQSVMTCTLALGSDSTWTVAHPHLWMSSTSTSLSSLSSPSRVTAFSVLCLVLGVKSNLKSLCSHFDAGAHSTAYATHRLGFLF